MNLSIKETQDIMNRCFDDKFLADKLHPTDALKEPFREVNEEDRMGDTTNHNYVGDVIHSDVKAGLQEGTHGNDTENENDVDASYEEITKISGWIEVSQGDDVSEVTLASFSGPKVKRNKKMKTRSKKSPKSKPKQAVSRCNGTSQFSDLEEGNGVSVAPRTPGMSPVSQTTGIIPDLDNEMVKDKSDLTVRPMRWDDTSPISRNTDKKEPSLRAPKRKTSLSHHNGTVSLPIKHRHEYFDNKSDDVVIFIERRDSPKNKEPPWVPKRPLSNKIMQKGKSESSLDKNDIQVAQTFPLRKEVSFYGLKDLQKEIGHIEPLQREHLGPPLSSLEEDNQMPTLVESLGLDPIADDSPATSEIGTPTKRKKRLLKGIFKKLFRMPSRDENVEAGDNGHGDNDDAHLDHPVNEKPIPVRDVKAPSRRPMAFTKARSQPSIRTQEDFSSGNGDNGRHERNLVQRARGLTRSSTSGGLFRMRSALNLIKRNHHEHGNLDQGHPPDVECGRHEQTPVVRRVETKMSRSKANLMSKSRSMPSFLDSNLEEHNPGSKPSIKSTQVSEPPRDTQDNKLNYSHDEEIQDGADAVAKSKTSKKKKKQMYLQENAADTLNRRKKKKKKKKKATKSSKPARKRKDVVLGEIDLTSPLTHTTFGSTAITQQLGSAGLNGLQPPFLRSPLELSRNVTDEEILKTIRARQFAYPSSPSFSKPPSIFGSNW